MDVLLGLAGLLVLISVPVILGLIYLELRQRRLFGPRSIITDSGGGITNDKGVRWVDTKGSIDAGDFLMFARTVSDSSGIIYAVGCK